MLVEGQNVSFFNTSLFFHLIRTISAIFDGNISVDTLAVTCADPNINHTHSRLSL